MPDTLDERLEALAAARLSAPLDGLEDRVGRAVQIRRASAQTPAFQIRVAVTVAALAAGLAFGAFNAARPSHLSEMGVLSEDGLLAPSIRLGGGA
jgi:hypothetical protein